MTLKIKRNKQGNVRNKIIVCSCSLNQEKNKECERKSKSIKEDVIKWCGKAGKEYNDKNEEKYFSALYND